MAEVSFSSHPGHGSASQTVEEADAKRPENTLENNYGLKTAPGKAGAEGYVTRG